MVCLKNVGVSVTSGMSTSYAREVVSTCTQSQSRMQAVADLLLLNSDVRPVTSESLAVFRESYSKCRETVITRTKGLLVITGRINEQLHSVMSKWHDVCICISDMSELVIGLIECCSHAAYLVAVNKPNCKQAQSGIVDTYRLCKGHTEIELACKQFKQLTLHELTPSVLVQICSDVNKNLTVLTECCKTASELTTDTFNQEQFKLCVKSFTSNASCLMSSIRCFKTKPTPVHYGRCISFYDALTTSTKALVNFATEEQFVGKPAILSPEGVEAKKVIFGACLSVVSSVIQLCKVIRELAYNNKNINQRDKVSACIDAISKASSQLADALLHHNTDDDGREPRAMTHHGQRSFVSR